MRKELWPQVPHSGRGAGLYRRCARTGHSSQVQPPLCAHRPGAQPHTGGGVYLVGAS